MAVIELRNTDDPRDAVHRAVQALAEGKLVALPTETVYGLAASALDASAIDRLTKIKGRQPGQPFTLAIKSADDALDYVPTLNTLARRLARRCWPGPVTLVLDDNHPDSLVRQLPESVQPAIVPNGSIGLRVPAHDLILAVLRLTEGPVALTSANPRGGAEATTAAEVVEFLGEDVDLVLDDGKSKFGQPSSVIRIADGNLQLLREGVINTKALKRLSSLIISFVCTGNTCRSPMAEMLARKRIAERLKCDAEELEDQGVMVLSAGIAAMAGGKASPEAVHIMNQRGLNLTHHESRPLEERLVRFSDLILTMTRSHQDAILAQWPDAADRTRVLCRNNSDISDPIGGTIDDYQRCADQIDSQLEDWLDELDFSAFPGSIDAGDESS